MEYTVEDICDTCQCFEVNAWDQDCLVGRGVVIIQYKKHGKPMAQIEDIFVDEEHRRKGVATEITKKLIEIAKDKQCYKIILDCREHALKLYSKLGFTIDQNNMRLNLT